MVKRFLEKSGLLGALVDALEDPRDPRGQKWSFAFLVSRLFLGVLLACKTMKCLEQITERCGARIPDSTMAWFVERLNPAPLRQVLIDQVLRQHRAKSYAPCGFPFGILTIDGKTNWVGDWEADPECQRQDGKWHFRVLRACLTSARSVPCVDQCIIPAGTNDGGAFPAFWRGLVESYKHTDLFRAVTLDAGFASLENARLVDEDGYGYIVNIKGNQAGMLHEVVRLMRLHGPKLEAETGWEVTKGTKIKRQLFRLTKEIVDLGGWPHIRQVWFVRQITRDWKGGESVFERVYATNLLVNALNPDCILRVVRRHWAIENDCNGTLDIVWGEDAHAMTANKKHVAEHQPLRVFMWLNMLAYNALTLMRNVHLRIRRTWDEIFAALRDVLFTRRPLATEEVLAFVLA